MTNRHWGHTDANALTYRHKEKMKYKRHCVTKTLRHIDLKTHKRLDIQRLGE